MFSMYLVSLVTLEPPGGTNASVRACDGIHGSMTGRSLVSMLVPWLLYEGCPGAWAGTRPPKMQLAGPSSTFNVVMSSAPVHKVSVVVCRVTPVPPYSTGVDTPLSKAGKCIYTARFIPKGHPKCFTENTGKSTSNDKNKNSKQAKRIENNKSKQAKAFRVKTIKQTKKYI